MLDRCTRMFVRTNLSIEVLVMQEGLAASPIQLVRAVHALSITGDSSLSMNHARIVTASTSEVIIASLFIAMRDIAGQGHNKRPWHLMHHWISCEVCRKIAVVR